MGYSTYGDGRAIIEILNIGFEPLLTKEEYKVYKCIGRMKRNIFYLTQSLSVINKNMLYMDSGSQAYSWFSSIKEKHTKSLRIMVRLHDENEKLFRIILNKNKNIKRVLYTNREFKNEDQYRNIAIFESDLTRCFGCKDMEHSYDIISIVTYYTEIFDSLINNGFRYKGKNYVFFTAGAGQTRCKKSTFVSEHKLIPSFNRLFCGLTRKEINRLGGMNTNKFLAYTSLCQTNSEIWKDFNIDRAVVVDDIEFELSDQDVRYIYTETPEDKKNIEELQNQLDDITLELREINLRKTQNKGLKRNKSDISYEKELRQNKKDIIDSMNKIKNKYHSIKYDKMSINIPFTDGFGISLKKMPTSMIRLPFIKGLETYVPRKVFKEWCKNNNIKINAIKDIYGKEYYIDDIDYIFTKSQFKMWKYYKNIYDVEENLITTGWEIYKNNFKKFGCDACRCNVEKNVKLNAKTNYQILQTLTTEMTDDEIKQLASYDINSLNGIGRNVQCMLNVLGANQKRNDKLDYFQQSLILYPEMLKDYYVKSSLKNTKDSMIQKFRSGKFSIEGAYTYAIPDVLACLQWWFTGERDLNKLGFVKQGEVCCDLFENEEKVDCLRSPHLDHSHCIRKNIKRQEDKQWIKSKGVYISVHDNMSKLLMYDNDGDKLLVHRNKTIINCALRFQKKYKMIPNYYEMPKADAQELTNRSLFEGIVLAYHHGNIGTPSNEITKVFMCLNPETPKEEVEKAIEVVALRCVDVNFTIDYAKTLYKPTIPKNVLEKYKQYSGKKVPHFFRFAKDKTINQVEPLGKCNIDRIYNIVKSNRIVFKDLLGKYSYKKLMNDKTIDITTEDAEKIINLYYSISDANTRRLSYIDFDNLEIDEKNKINLQLEFNSRKQRQMFEKYVDKTPEYITDVLVKALQDDIRKDTLWKLFGDVIYSNLEKNLKDTKICEVCKCRFESNNNKMKYCKKCAKEVKNEQNKDYYHKQNT